MQTLYIVLAVVAAVAAVAAVTRESWLRQWLSRLRGIRVITEERAVDRADGGVCQIRFAHVRGCGGAQRINEAIAQSIDSKLAEFAEIELQISLQSDEDHESRSRNTANLEIDVTLTSPVLISFLCRHDAMAPGYWNPWHGLGGLTFRCATGAPVSLRELFVPGEAWRHELTRRLRDWCSSWEPPDLQHEVLEGQAYYLTADALVLAFDKYVVGPGVMGAPAFPIPWTELVHLVSQETYEHLIPRRRPRRRNTRKTTGLCV